MHYELFSEHVLGMKILKCKLSSLDNGFILALFNKHHLCLACFSCVLYYNSILTLHYNNGKLVSFTSIIIQQIKLAKNQLKHCQVCSVSLFNAKVLVFKNVYSNDSEK